METIRKIISEEVSKLFEEESVEQRLKYFTYMFQKADEERQEAVNLLISLHDTIQAEINTTDCQSLIQEIFQELSEWRRNP
jgi:hypothetical protein